MSHVRIVRTCNNYNWELHRVLPTDSMITQV